MLGLESGLAEALSSAGWLKPFFLFVVPLQVALGVLAFTLANRSGTRDVRVDSSGIEARTLTGRLIRIGFGEIGEAYEDTYAHNGHRVARTVVKSRDGVRKVTFNIHNPRFGELLAALRASGVDLIDREALKRDPAAYRKRRERRQRRARLERQHGPLKVPGSGGT